MDPTSHNFDLQPQQAHPDSRKWTVVLVSAFVVLAGLIAIDCLAVGSVEAKPRPVQNVIRLTAAVQIAPVVYLSVSPGIKPGPGGQLHDAFSVTDFNVHAGQPVKLVINNTDTVPHSINAPAAGVNIVAQPGTHTYTLLVHKTGRFLWMCMYPCDPYSMAHVGYMRGYITSV